MSEDTMKNHIYLKKYMIYHIYGYVSHTLETYALRIREFYLLSPLFSGRYGHLANA